MAEKQSKKTPREEVLARVFEWFETDRTAKRAIFEELEECQRMYKGDHWDLHDLVGRPLRTESQKKNRPNTVENIVFSLIEGLVAEFSEDVDLVDYPVEPGDDEAASIMTDLKKFIKYKNRLASEREKYLRWFFLYGTGIWHIYWDPHWKGGKGPNRWRGDVRWKALHPQVVFPDARCRESIEDGRRIHKAFYRTQEYIKETYGVEVPPDVVSGDMILEDEETGHGAYRQGEDEALLVETWYKGKPLFFDKDEKDHGTGMHVVWWAGEQKPIYLAHANYVYYDPDEDPLFPFDFRQRYPRENSVWGYGEAHFLKSPQIVMNKTTELILESHMHFSLGQTFYRQGSITPKQEKFLKKFGTLPNMYFPVSDLDNIKRIHGAGVSPSLPTEANRLQKVMETIIGRFDISQGRTPGSVVAFRALDLLAARARVRLRSAEQAIMSAYESCGNYINNLIYKFYTERRAYRILSDTMDQTELVMVNPQTGEEIPFAGQLLPGYTVETRKVNPVSHEYFELDKLKKVYAYDETTGIGEVQPYSEEMAETIRMTEELKDAGEDYGGVEYEVYCPQLDVMCKVSSSMPTDRAFYMEMAKEMFMAQIIDEETFWYVIQNGKFPPYEKIVDKKRRQIIGAAQLQAQQVSPVEQALNANPQLRQKLQSLSPEMQQQVMARVEGEAGQQFPR